MKISDSALILALLTSGSLLAVAHWLESSRVAALKLEQLEELEAFSAQLVSLKVDGLWVPASLSLPASISQDKRAQEVLSRIVDWASATSGNGDSTLTLSTTGDASVADRVNKVLLRELIEEHPELRSSPSDWLNSVNARIRALEKTLETCPLYPFGSDEVHADNLDQLVRAVESFHDALSDDERLVVGAGVESIIREIERTASTARPMPVINGEARGTLPAQGSLVRFCEEAQPIPATQTLSRRSSGGAEFVLRTRGGSAHIYARLISPQGDVWRGFVRAGESISVELPTGDFTLRYAMGSSWFGYSYLFGPGTTFSEAGDVIDLRSNYQTTIELIPQVGGNLTERAIDANTF